MLQIIRIVHSADLFERDLIELENSVSVHLNFIKSKLKCNLKPKHHNMTHYATVIRLMGPIIHMSTMRYEAKHKMFTDQARQTNNFVNIGHWLAERCQKIDSLQSKYVNAITLGRMKEFDLNAFQDFNHLIHQIFKDSKKVQTVSWIQINSNYYSKNYFVIHDDHLHEIQGIIRFKDQICFLCNEFNIIEFDSFLNSVKIEKKSPVSYSIVKHNNIDSFKSYEKKIIAENMYIIVDTVDVWRLIK